MGSAEEEIRAIHASYGGARALYEAEFPRRDVYLGAFYIDKAEVTNAKYKVFIESTGRAPPVVEREWAALYNWSAGSYPDGMADHPVVLVSFDDAEAYCEWAGQSLPSEAQWEKAARGAGGKNYPWGDQWDSSKLNSAATWSDHELPTIEVWTDWWRDVYNGELRARVVTTQPVGAYPAGASPFGVLDMAGNVFEWTRDWYQPYEGSHYENPEFGEMYRVIRGGDWYLDRIYTRTSARLRSPPDHRVPNIGFRCVCVHD
jgi:formylglycine-generating enzyme required for sulfatase activity